MVTEENMTMSWERGGGGFKMWPRNDHIFHELQTAGPSSSSQDTEALYKRWMTTVEEYSFRQLTRQSDKLPAIQNIAAEMSRAVDDTYIPFAGMWRGNLKRELLWHSLPPLPIQRSEVYGAPSWSWASAGSDVRWAEGKPDHGVGAPEAPCPFNVLDLGRQHPRYAASNFLEVEGFTKPLLGLGPATTSSSSSWRSIEHYFPFPLLAADADDGAHVTIGSARLDLKDYIPRAGAPLLYLHIRERYPSGLVLESSNPTERTWFRIGVASIFTAAGGTEMVQRVFASGSRRKIIII